MEINNLREKIQKENVVVLLAPSFPVDFNPDKIIHTLKIFGFKRVVELTFGAKIVNEHYHKIISERDKKNKSSKFISSVCPLVVSYIKTKHPNYAKSLLPIMSPMVIMDRIVKKNFELNNIKTCFIGPCIAKKQEAKEFGVDYAITFKEFYPEYIKIIKNTKIEKLDFDKFYNDFTKIYPIAGGLSKSLHYKNILLKSDVVSADTNDMIDKVIKKDKIFYDFLFCKGGCLGGPGVNTKAPTIIKEYKIKGYLNIERHHKIGKRKGTKEYSEGIDFSREF
jgi:iron only hydrogenase large subunit-like protein